MRGSNSAMKIHNRDVSRGLIDKFSELPDDLILEILRKIKDIKTLIRCSSVSKHLNSLMSRIHPVSLTVTIYPGQEEDTHLCSQSHSHTPVSAITSIMEVFTNPKSIKVEYCRCFSLYCRINTKEVPWIGFDVERDFSFNNPIEHILLWRDMKNFFIDIELDDEQ